MDRRHFLNFAGKVSVVAGSPVPFALAQDFAANATPRVRVSEPANVIDFGARGDGTGDDTSSVLKAIDAASTIFFPPGTYRLRSIAINASGKTLLGAYKKSRLAPVGNEDMFVLRGSDIRMHDLMFTNEGGSRTAGSYVRTQGNFVQINRCFFENGHIGIVSTSTLLTVSDCDFRSFAPGTGICIQINGGFSVMLDKIRADHPANKMPLAGINITSTGDTTISNSGLIHCGTDLLMNPSAGKVIASVYASNTFFDTAARGVALMPAQGGAIVRTHFVNCWSASHTGSGTIIDAGKGTIDGITLLNHQSNLNGGDGVLIRGPQCLNVQILGGQMAQNTGSGVAVSERARKFRLSNVVAGAVHGLKGNSVGIQIDKDCGDYQITNCVCQDNRVGQILDASMTGTVKDNVGIVTRNSGVGEITTGASSTVISHGLAATPSPGDISLTLTSNPGANSIYLDIGSIGAKSFTVRSANVAQSALRFVWQARCLGT